MRSAPVKRIDDVLTLRARQFREDAGPLAHNVRPESYIEINNFYTSTVYEKGAEVIRMLRLLVGPEAYDTALTLYFDRHDGQACTIEDWLQVFQDATGRDLSQFKRWYTQAGTPKLTARWRVEGADLVLTLTQEVPATPGQPLKEPAVIPVLLALYGPDGTQLCDETLHVLDGTEDTLSWPLADLGHPQRVIPSLLRGFSAPVLLDAPLTTADRLVLLAHDSDPFNRWEAGRSLMRETLIAANSPTAPGPTPPSSRPSTGPRATTPSTPPSARWPSPCPPKTTSPRPWWTRASSPTRPPSTWPASASRPSSPPPFAPRSRASTTASTPARSTAPTPPRPPRAPCATPASPCSPASKAPTAPAPNSPPPVT
jgi:hypothetical protein